VPNLADLRARCARLEVDYGGETIVVYYRPALVSEQTQAILRELQRTGDFRPLHAELERVLIDWDLTDGDAPVPLTDAGFTLAGIGVVGTVTNAVVRDVGNPTWAPLPSPARPIPSSNGSSPTGSWAPPPTTSISSSAPNGHTSPPGTWPDSPTPAAASAGFPGSAGSGGP
jgi:hypothetical protein